MMKSRGVLLAVLAAFVALVMVTCSYSPGTIVGMGSDGRSISLTVGEPSISRLLEVDEYDVTSLDIEIYNPDGSFLWGTEWLQSMGAKTYDIQVGQLGTYEIIVVHNGDDGSNPISAEESAEFTIVAMMITVIDLTPGAIGLLRIDADIAVTGVEVDPEDIELMVDETRQLTATVAPSDATDPSVSWSSSDEDVADVDGNGLVTALSRGTATITVKTTFGDYSAGCEVTVRSKPLDAFIVSYGQPKTLLANDGNAVFSLDQTLNPAVSGQDVALGDLDNDGDLDAYVASYGRDEVWMNNGGTFVLKTQTSPPPPLAGTLSYGVALGFIDGDEYLDAVTVYPGGTCFYMKGNGDGTFSLNQSFSAGTDTFTIDLGDLDGDGDLDIMLAGYPYGRYYAYNGSQFTYAGMLPRSGINRQDVKLGDMDGDGDLDAVFAVYNSSTSEVYLNQTPKTDPPSTIRFSGPQPFGRYTYTTGVSLGYINNDSNLDVVLCGLNSPAEVWFGNGSGGFLSNSILNSAPYARDVALGDLDDDGDMDAIFVRRDSYSDLVFLNNGSGILTNSGQNLGNSRAMAVAVGPLLH